MSLWRHTTAGIAWSFSTIGAHFFKSFFKAGLLLLLQSRTPCFRHCDVMFPSESKTKQFLSLSIRARRVTSSVLDSTPLSISHLTRCTLPDASYGDTLSFPFDCYYFVSTRGPAKAKMIFATGWASVAATYRDLERTETAEKIKEGTVNLVDRSMDGLSKVLCPCAFFFVCFILCVCLRETDDLGSRRAYTR